LRRVEFLRLLTDLVGLVEEARDSCAGRFARLDLRGVGVISSVGTTKSRAGIVASSGGIVTTKSLDSVSFS
jgi:hypothetical protein